MLGGSRALDPPNETVDRIRAPEHDTRADAFLGASTDHLRRRLKLRRRLDQVGRIPMRGKVALLNAAVAGSVLLFAAAEQRGDAPPPTAVEAADTGPAPTAEEGEPLAETAAPDSPEPTAGELLPDDTQPG